MTQHVPENNDDPIESWIKKLNEVPEMNTHDEEFMPPQPTSLTQRIAFAVIAIALLLAVGMSMAHAQVPTLDLTAAPMSGVGKATPALTLTVSNAGTRVVTCTASGGWSGTRAPGTSIQPEITTTTTYSVACSAPAIAAETTARLDWVAATTNTDGSAYTNPKGYQILGATTQAGLATATPRQILNPSATGANYTGLTPGTWWFCVKSLNLLDAASVCSNAASKSIAAGVVAWTDTKSVTVTITAPPVPNAPTGLVVTEVTAFDVRQNADGSLYAVDVPMVPVSTRCAGNDCTVLTRRAQ